MTEVYSPPLLAEDLKEIVAALSEQADGLETLHNITGNEITRRRAHYLRTLAARLAKEPTCGKSFG